MERWTLWRATLATILLLNASGLASERPVATPPSASTPTVGSTGDSSARGSDAQAAALAQTLSSMTAEEWAALPPELRAELKAFKPTSWEAGVSARLAAGWRDNVLMSAVTSEERFFVRSQWEAFLWRLPKGPWEYVGFLNGDVIRYASPLPELSGEQSWFVHGEARWQPRPALRATVLTEGYFQDQVFDLSATETERLVARLRAHGAVLGAEFQVKPAKPLALVALAQAHESRYRSFTENFGELKMGGRLLWNPAEAVSVSVSVLSRVRDYQDRPAYTAGGRALLGTRLSLHQDEIAVEAKGVWGHWSAGWMVMGLENRDGGSGYFNYAERRARGSVEWKKGRWRWTWEAAAVQYRYRVQTVGVGFDPPKRRREDVELALKVERTWRGPWSVFAEVQRERSRANEEAASYSQSTVMLGIGYAP